MLNSSVLEFKSPARKEEGNFSSRGHGNLAQKSPPEAHLDKDEMLLRIRGRKFRENFHFP